MNKNYGLTNKPNAGVSDNAPDWMNSFFEKVSDTTEKPKKQHPFEGINDPILNPDRIGLK